MTFLRKTLAALAAACLASLLAGCDSEEPTDRSSDRDGSSTGIGVNQALRDCSPKTTKLDVAKCYWVSWISTAGGDAGNLVIRFEGNQARTLLLETRNVGPPTQTECIGPGNTSVILHSRGLDSTTSVVECDCS